MQKTLCLLGSAFLLSACNGSGDDIPDPSPEQAKAAEVAYIDLRDGKYDDFLAHLAPELQSYFKENEKTMKKFSREIPKDDYKSKTLMVKKIDEGSDATGQYKVSYEIAYPKNLVQYDVSFDQPNGRAEIQNFNIRVYGGR